MKEFDPLIDPTTPPKPTTRRHIYFGIGSGGWKPVAVPEVFYGLVVRLVEEARKKAAEDEEKKKADNPA